MSLPWIRLAPGAPYFCTEDGEPWTPLGQNDALPWPELSGVLYDRDLKAVEAYLARIAAHGVTCLRLMLESSDNDETCLERPAGVFNEPMVQSWDRLFALCAKYGLRILLTPFDTFWLWERWQEHPYNARNGGPCEDRSMILTCNATRDAVKRRLAFATERWGGSGVLFAWDVWNEIHLSFANQDFEALRSFAQEMSSFLRQREIDVHGRAHPQTISAFWPHLEEHVSISDLVLNDELLDFASIHLYADGTIDAPRNTVDPALATARLIRAALGRITDERPLMDSEHGPIHTFKDFGITLNEDFDDEYFRHIQWAHLAAGGAGGGMRWPNRHPHVLTDGMRRAQLAMARFLPLIDWTTFRRRNISPAIDSSERYVTCIGSSDDRQAVIWLVRTDTIGVDGRLKRDAPPVITTVGLRGFGPGKYCATIWNTETGRILETLAVGHDGNEYLRIPVTITTDAALALTTLTESGA